MKSFVHSAATLLITLYLSANSVAFSQGVGVRTQALDSALWTHAQWISVVDAPVVTGRTNDATRAADGASWFVTTIRNKGKVKRAVWMTAGLGVYDLYVNKQLVGDEVLKPGFTHYQKTKLSFTYDITRSFNKKRGAVNTLAVQVTPGWWADKIVGPSGEEGMKGKKCAFRGVLAVTYADGSKEYFGSDTTHWKAAIAGPVKHAAIFDGEEYDARVPMGYDVTPRYKAPEVNTEFSGAIIPTMGAEVYLRHDLALQPVKAYVWQGTTGASNEAHGKVVVQREYNDAKDFIVKKGETLVIDFGQNCAAVPSFTFQAKDGTTLTCLPAELLNDGNGVHSRGMDGPEGSVHRRNLRIGDRSIRLDYTFGKSDTPVTYTPRNTFFGYRFVSITATDEVVISSVKSIPVSSITKGMECGSITTGNEMVNRLISNTLWGQRSNYLSVTTDCPQRNERLGWTADTQVYAETGTFFANTRTFFSKWLRDLRDTQCPHGGYPGVAPHGQYASWDGEMMRVGWADAGVIVPWTMWKQYGDTQIIDESWASMERFMQLVNTTKYDHTALIKENGNYQWGDWLSYEPLESCGNGIYGEGGLRPEAIEYWNYLSASYWLIDAQMMRDMATATGRDAQRYEQMAAEAKAYVKERFVNTDGTFKFPILNTMQTPALFALKNKVVEGEGRENMIQRLRENFAEHDFCLQTGFLGTSILMPTLTENGMVDIAYRLLFQRKNPSWLYSIDNGATTIWERWNSYMLDKGMGPSGMNSFNHYAYGVVCQWIWENVAGIKADTAEPGFKHIIMSPQIDWNLGFVKACYHSAHGDIVSEWKQEGGKKIWKFAIPKGCTATVTNPFNGKVSEYKAGCHIIVSQ